MSPCCRCIIYLHTEREGELYDLPHSCCVDTNQYLYFLMFDRNKIFLTIFFLRRIKILFDTRIVVVIKT